MGDHNREFEFKYSIIDKEGAVKDSDTFKLKSRGEDARQNLVRVS